MNLQQRIDLLTGLGKYLLSGDEDWQEAKRKARLENSWFIPGFIESAVTTIAYSFLQKDVLDQWTAGYQLPAINPQPKSVGIVMAGNIPLVGFHDLLCVFITGHKAVIKPSARDTALIKHLVDKMSEWDHEIKDLVRFADIPKSCYAYIATGSNNSAGYFEYYFKKYPHIIRRNRTSVAILDGNESAEDLSKLADDIFLYFGLGCRNVTKLHVPANYDFIPLLNALKKYEYLAENHKYRNNYDYNLAIHLLNKKNYMSNGAVLLIEEASPFSPVSQVHYEHYQDRDELIGILEKDNSIQCIAGKGLIPFGQTQKPAITDYADGVDTLEFNTKL